MPIQFKIPNHMIMPFGCPKWDIEQIEVAGVSTDGTYFTSKSKCVHIDRNLSDPLRLSAFPTYFPEESEGFPRLQEGKEALAFIFRYIREQCQLATDHEERFLDAYQRWIENQVQKRYWDRAFLALMPFPQAHVYARDPLQFGAADFLPGNMFKLNFAFWTGKRLVAVEIDGNHGAGSRNRIRDRLLAQAGVEVIHILNDEIDRHGWWVIERLLPTDVTGIGFQERHEIDDRLPSLNPLNLSANPAH